MPSPFPGMDPYLEASSRWLDFHNDLAAEIRTALNRVLDPRYIARLTSYVAYEVVAVTPQPRHHRQSDAAVVRLPQVSSSASTPAATIAPAPVESAIPWEVPLMLDRVEIRTAQGEQLVTVIEILSPSNKRRNHENGQEYLRKRRELFRSSVHLIELDLLRAGDRMPLEEPVPAASYYLTLSRADCRPRVQVWPIQLQDALPTMPVPMLEEDPDVPLDMGAVVGSVYERGAYEREIDYREAPPPPPLSEAEVAWVDGLLREHGRR